MIKLVATDIDVTILIPEGEFTPGVKECVKKLCSSGVKVVLVTGRMNAAATRIAQDLGLIRQLCLIRVGLLLKTARSFMKDI